MIIIDDVRVRKRRLPLFLAVELFIGKKQPLDFTPGGALSTATAPVTWPSCILFTLNTKLSMASSMRTSD